MFYYYHYYYSFNIFLNKSWFLRVCSTSLLKTLLEKEKLVVTSNFPFSHIVFWPFGYPSAIFYQISNCRLQILSIRKSLNLSFGKELNLRTFAGIKDNFNPSPTSSTLLTFSQTDLTLSHTTNFTLFQTKRVCRRQS